MKHTQSKAQPLTYGESVYVFYAMTKKMKGGREEEQPHEYITSFAKLPVLARPNFPVRQTKISLGRQRFVMNASTGTVWCQDILDL